MEPLMIATRCKECKEEFPSRKAVKRHLFEQHRIRKAKRHYVVLKQEQIDNSMATRLSDFLTQKDKLKAGNKIMGR